MKKYQAGMTYCTLKDAEQQVEIKKGHKAIDEDEDNVWIVSIFYYCKKDQMAM